VTDAIPLAAALRAVLDGIESVSVAVAESLDLLDDGLGSLDVLAGSSQPDVEQMLGSLTQAQQTGRELVGNLASVRATVEDILAKVVELIGDGTSPTMIAPVEDGAARARGKTGGRSSSTACRADAQRSSDARSIGPGRWHDRGTAKWATHAMVRRGV